MGSADTDRADELKKLFLLRYDNMRETALQSLQDRVCYGVSIPQNPREAYMLGVAATLQYLDYAEEFWDALLEEYAGSIN